MSMDRRRFMRLGAGAAIAPLLPGCGGDGKVPATGVPRSDFDEDSTAEEVTEGIDLKGKIAVVTGCTSGIGYETMRVLARRGCYVIGTGRTLQSAQKACSSVIGVTTPVQLELSDFDSVAACADAIRSLNSPIDMLICNAGMRGSDYETAYGVEKHFVVNHLGHFILVYRLLERMYLAWQGRVVVVASRAAYRSAPEDGIQFDDLRMTRDYSPGRAYAHSKLANVLFSLELARLLKGTRITSNALHPGVIDTNIARNVSVIARGAFSAWTSMTGKSIEQGAATSCFVATSPLLGSTSGQYFEDCNAVTVTGGSHMHDSEQASRLWLASEELTRDYLVEIKRPDWNEFENGIRKKKE
ncbi:MAG: SDR family oxidoreductase [Gammaproteobacteria bacterium]|nr:SDR family oxidoreductase [Gammaproteobacteria bacterium]MDH4313899.1 SDR family oxidoreductase [Gammaproteobacteria bacterium]MDH5213826.1 SDR family oxidoreductase [Gammaproteobacteria bacterium]MDH5500920.1 SDR family oxidoreductase [Gammaproteobacteria bacterium]